MYFGWYIVGLAGIIFMLLIGTTIGSFGLFVLPVSQDLGLSRADMNTAFILLQLGSAMCAPFVGRALDRFPARRIIAIAAIMFGISMTTLALSHAIWLSALVLLLLLPIAEVGAGATAFGVILVRWFSANRGKALLFFNLGGPLSAIFVIPVMAKLIGSTGWRNTLMISAGAITLLILIAVFIIRERPAPGEIERVGKGNALKNGGIAPDGDSSEQIGPVPVGQILRMPRFWLVSLACAMPLGVAISVAVSLYPFALHIGFSPSEATGLLSMSGFSAIGGIMLASLVIDRFDRTLLLAGLFLIDAVAVGLMPMVTSYEIMMVAVVLLGVSSAVLTPVILTYQADVFGAASFGTVRGMMGPILSIVGALMVRFAGEVYDRTGEYDLMFQTFVAAEIVSASILVALLLWKSKPQIDVPDLSANSNI